jgi:hypothetical protein
MNFTHRIARLRIGRRRHGAGIQHDHICGSLVARRLKAGSREVGANRGSIRIGGATAEVLYREGSHGIFDSWDSACRKKYSKDARQRPVAATLLLALPQEGSRVRAAAAAHECLGEGGWQAQSVE